MPASHETSGNAATGTPGTAGSAPAAGGQGSPVLLLALVAAVVAFAVYANTLVNGFVFDDLPQVLQNPWLRSFRFLPNIFSSHVAAAVSNVSNYYRPVMNVIYLFTWQLFGPAPWAYHLVNLLFHAACTVVVFLLILRLVPAGDERDDRARRLAALAGALLFAVHPVHTEAVAWVAGIPDLSFTLFYLLAVYLYLGNGGRDRALSLAFFFAAAISKEPALTLPFVLIACDVASPERRSLAGIVKRQLPYVAVACVYFALRLWALKGFAPVTRHAELTLYQCVINVFPLFGNYLATLLVPVQLNFFHVLHPVSSLFEGITPLWLALCVAFLAAAAVAFKKSRAAFVALVLVAAPLLPALYIRALGENSFAERYLYLPSAGLAILAALAVGRALRSSQAARAAAAGVAALVLAIFAVQTVQRNQVWKDDYTLWSDTVAKSPEGYLPNLLLGDTLVRMGYVDRAIESYRRAAALPRSDSGVHDHLGAAYMSKGMLDDAIAEFRAAIAIAPQVVDSYNNLGLAYNAKGMPREAAGEFEKALELQPDSVQTLNNMGLACKNMNRFDLAIHYYREALRLRPDVAGLHFNLARAYQLAGQPDKAAEEMRIGQQLQ